MTFMPFSCDTIQNPEIRAKLEQIAKESGVESRVIFAAHVEHKDLPNRHAGWRELLDVNVAHWLQWTDLTLTRDLHKQTNEAGGEHPRTQQSKADSDLCCVLSPQRPEAWSFLPECGFWAS